MPRRESRPDTSGVATLHVGRTAAGNMRRHFSQPCVACDAVLDHSGGRLLMRPERSPPRPAQAALPSATSSFFRIDLHTYFTELRLDCSLQRGVVRKVDQVIEAPDRSCDECHPQQVSSRLHRASSAQRSDDVRTLSSQSPKKQRVLDDRWPARNPADHILRQRRAHPSQATSARPPVAAGQRSPFRVFISSKSGISGSDGFTTVKC